MANSDEAGREDTWLEFNDTTVKPFKLSKLATECYGSDKKEKKSNIWGSRWAGWGESSKSAYMVVYERDHKTKIELVANTSEHKSEIITSIGYDPFPADFDQEEVEAADDKKSLISDDTTEAKDGEVGKPTEKDKPTGEEDQDQGQEENEEVAVEKATVVVEAVPPKPKEDKVVEVDYYAIRKFVPKHIYKVS